MAASEDTTITVSRTGSRQTFRDNAEHENAEEYYRHVCYALKTKSIFCYTIVHQTTQFL